MAAQATTRSTADGYTFSVAHMAAHISNAHFLELMPHDPLV